MGRLICNTKALKPKSVQRMKWKVGIMPSAHLRLRGDRLILLLGERDLRLWGERLALRLPPDAGLISLVPSRPRMATSSRGRPL